jgi:hypothetical protein
MRQKFLIQASIILFLLCLAFPVYSQQPKKITWGVYGGWSWGTGYTFQWHYRPWSDRHVLQFHLGGYVQLNLSRRLGLQLDANYQNVLDEWTFHHPSFPYNSGEDSYGFWSLGLKGIFSLSKRGLIRPYIAAGGGINWGEWYSYSGIYYHLVGSPGIKIFLWRSHPNLALNLGSSLVYVYDPNQWHTNDAFYIKLNFGIEF